MKADISVDAIKAAIDAYDSTARAARDDEFKDA